MRRLIPKAQSLPLRQIHLDFHTSEHIPDVGCEFNAREFAETLKTAHVESVNVFAKCHHGLAYYPSKFGPRHPALKFDLLGEMIEACHHEGILAPIYYTVAWEEASAKAHPEWRQVLPSGKLGQASALEAGWHRLCFNNPYQDYVEAQISEILKRYKGAVDGLWFDIVNYQAPGCVCEFCLRSMRELGLSPKSEDDLKIHTRVIIDRFLARMTKLTRAKAPGAFLYYNGLVKFPTEGRENFQTHIDIESLPTSAWGYSHFPFYVRYIRTKGVPYSGMTARFVSMWGDFGTLKSAAQLDFECATMLANGAACAIGDQLHPRGKLNAAVYKTIGSVFKKVEYKTPWIEGAAPLADMALLVCKQSGLSHGTLRPLGAKGHMSSEYGASKMLLELHCQFDVIDEEADFKKYKLIVAADHGAPSQTATKKLRDFIKTGGKVLFTGSALLDEEKRRFVLSDLGVEYVRTFEYDPSYFRPSGEAARDMPAMPHVLYGPANCVRPQTGARKAGAVFTSYFNRAWEHFCSHRQTPPDKRASWPAAVITKNAAYFYGNIFANYFEHGNLAYKQIVGNLIDILAPQRLLHTDAPSWIEATVCRQTRPKVRHIVHLVNYQNTRIGDHRPVIDEVRPVHDVAIQLRLPKKPKRAYLAPGGEELPFECANGCASARIPSVADHLMAVFE
jgi:hypothetical protein